LLAAEGVANLKPAAHLRRQARVRLAAIKATGGLAGSEALARLLDIVLKSQDEAERTEAAKSVVRACGRAGGPDRAEPVLAALSKASGANRAALLRMLAMIGGPKALAAVLADTKSAEAATQDAAVRALADWQAADRDAAAALLEIARTTEKQAPQVIALRGYFRLLGLARDGSPEQRVGGYKDGLAAAKRPDEKRLALAGLAPLRCTDALKVVMECLDDPALGADAAMAAVRIVVPEGQGEQPLRGSEAVEAMTKVAAAAKDAKVRERAQRYLDSVKP
jgi:hypothetical protein